MRIHPIIVKRLSGNSFKLMNKMHKKVITITISLYELIKFSAISLKGFTLTRYRNLYRLYKDIPIEIAGLLMRFEQKDNQARKSR